MIKDRVREVRSYSEVMTKVADLFSRVDESWPKTSVEVARHVVRQAVEQLKSSCERLLDEL